MSKYVTATKTVDIDIDIDDFDTDDLIDELESRGVDVYEPIDDSQTLLKLYELKRSDSLQFDKEFADFIYKKIGRIL